MKCALRCWNVHMRSGFISIYLPLSYLYPYAIFFGSLSLSPGVCIVELDLFLFFPFCFCVIIHHDEQWSASVERTQRVIYFHFKVNNRMAHALCLSMLNEKKRNTSICRWRNAFKTLHENEIGKIDEATKPEGALQFFVVVQVLIAIKLTSTNGKYCTVAHQLAENSDRGLYLCTIYTINHRLILTFFTGEKKQQQLLRHLIRSADLVNFGSLAPDNQFNSTQIIESKMPMPRESDICDVHTHSPNILSILNGFSVAAILAHAIVYILTIVHIHSGLYAQLLLIGLICGIGLVR